MNQICTPEKSFQLKLAGFTQHCYPHRVGDAYHLGDDVFIYQMSLGPVNRHFLSIKNGDGKYFDFQQVMEMAYAPTVDVLLRELGYGWALSMEENGLYCASKFTRPGKVFLNYNASDALAEAWIRTKSTVVQAIDPSLRANGDWALVLKALATVHSASSRYIANCTGFSIEKTRRLLARMQSKNLVFKQGGVWYR